MTAPTRPTDTLVINDSVALPDPALAPAIPGIRARFFRDDADYESLAELIGAALEADEVPYRPNADNLRIDMEANDGSNRFEDLVLVEVDGRLTEERLASHRKLEREIARAAREGDPRARAEHRRTWKIIHKSVEEHMTRKYGAER